jgi:hypothetical protein
MPEDGPNSTTHYEREREREREKREKERESEQKEREREREKTRKPEKLQQSTHNSTNLRGVLVGGAQVLRDLVGLTEGLRDDIVFGGRIRGSDLHGLLHREAVQTAEELDDIAEVGGSLSRLLRRVAHDRTTFGVHPAVELGVKNRLGIGHFAAGRHKVTVALGLAVSVLQPLHGEQP